MINDKEFKESVRSMRKRTSRMEREGDFWAKEEREALKSMFDDSVGITEMAIRLQRTEPAVTQQLEKMDLYRRKENPKRRKKQKNTSEHLECLCSDCRMDKKLCPFRNKYG